MADDPQGRSDRAAAAATRAGWRGGRARLAPEVQRSARLTTIYFTRVELERVRALAREHRLSVSELVRRVVLGRRLARPIPRVDLEVWAKLGPLAADLNQYVRAIREGRAAAPPLALLLEIRQLLDDVRAGLRGRETRETRS